MKRRQSFLGKIVLFNAEMGWMHIPIPKRVVRALGWTRESEAVQGTANGVPFRAAIRTERLPRGDFDFFEDPPPEPERSYFLYLYVPLRIALADPQPGDRVRLVIENDGTRDPRKPMPAKAGPRALDPPRAGPGRRRGSAGARRG